MQAIASSWFQAPFKTAASALFVIVGTMTAGTPLSAADRGIQGVWTGQYACAQGLTGLTLTIEGNDPSQLTARFEFYAVPENPDVPSGAFEMTGEFDRTLGELFLRPGEWIRRPAGYSATGLKGAFDPAAQTLAGRVLHSGCHTFAVSRTVSLPEQQAATRPTRENYRDPQRPHEGVASDELNQGYAPAQDSYLLGLRHVLGQDVQKDVSKGVALITAAAQAGNAAAQFALGAILEIGSDVPRDEGAALDWLRRAAQQGYLPAQTRLGVVLLERNSWQEGQSWLLKAAERGDPYAQYRLAQSYSNTNFGEAFRWYSKSAEQGFAPGQLGLGLSYWEGDVITHSAAPDYPKAVEWLRRAAEGGMARAKTYLGYAYAEGRAVPKDYDAAIQLWREAAAKNEPRAEEALGWAYENGRGVPQNLSEARSWYLRAAGHGNQAAHSKLESPEMDMAANREIGAALLLGLLAVGIATAGSYDGGSTSTGGDSDVGGNFDPCVQSGIASYSCLELAN